MVCPQTGVKQCLPHSSTRKRQQFFQEILLSRWPVGKTPFTFYCARHLIYSHTGNTRRYQLTCWCYSALSAKSVMADIQRACSLIRSRFPRPWCSFYHALCQCHARLRHLSSQISLASTRISTPACTRFGKSYLFCDRFYVLSYLLPHVCFSHQTILFTAE